MEKVEIGKRMEVLEVAKSLVDEVLIKMSELGVRRLGPVYIKNHHNNAHGTQTRLHIDSDELESDLVYCQRATNDNGVWYEFGEYSLPYIRPSFEVVCDFLAAIDEINAAIVEYNKKIDELNERSFIIV